MLAIGVSRLDRVGFYERKTLGERLGLGRYITREDIERRSPAPS